MAITKVTSGVITDGTIANADLAADAVGIAELSATGTASATTFLRGDNAWAEAGGGKVLQVVTTKSQTVVSSASIISYESTSAITNTQGVECLTATITPAATSNRLIVQCSFTGTSDSGSVHAIALFQDSGSNAIACCNSQTNGTDSGSTISMIWEQAAGTTSATTFKIRVGPHSSTTVYMNGRNNAAAWGGVPISTLQIWEIDV